MTAAAKLKELAKASNKAWRVMMSGPEASSCTIRGQEGANYLAWCAAADAEREHRVAHGWDYASTGKYNYMPKMAA